MILAAIVIARNPSRHGFEFETEEPTPCDEIMLVRPVDLRRVAEWAETTIDVIQSLNPELRRWTTPIRDEEYEVKVPAGTRRSGQGAAAGSAACGPRLAEVSTS